MAKLTDTQKTMIILGVGVLGAIGGGVGAYSEHGNLEVLQGEIQKLSDQKAANQLEINKVDGFEKKVVAYKGIVEMNSNILPTEEGLHQFIRDLAKMEEDNGVTIISLPRFDTGKPTRAITPIPMRMTVEGTSRAFLRFLNTIENNERLVNVSEVRVSSKSDTPEVQGQDMVHEWTLRLLVYRYDAGVGGTQADLIPRARELELKQSDAVAAIIDEFGRPAKIERYTLLPGRETRRDLFLDPRRRISGEETTTGEIDDVFERERTEVAALELLLEKARLELDAYKSAKSSKDYLLMAAAKRNFQKARGELEKEMERVARRSPPFQNRDNGDRYSDKVQAPYGELMVDAQREMEGIDQGSRLRVTEADAKSYRQQLQGLMDERQFEAAVEKALNVEQLVADAGTNVEPAAKEHLTEIREMRAQAQAQDALDKKNLDVQGVVRMERTSAVIINGRTLLPGKRLDRDTEFVRVEEGDRLIFKLQGREVDYLPKRPDLLEQNQPLLGLE